MGTWGTSITGNDTAQDLYDEYTAAFYHYGVEEALERIDRYVRQEMFDESDSEEWCNYYYSLADFMWKKGILTPEVRDRAVGMIDSGFGLELWAEAGAKTLASRQKALAVFKEKLLSPLFHCECSLFYFKQRNYRILCNRKDLLHGLGTGVNHHIFWGINKPWVNPDSQLVAAMGKQTVCGPYTGSEEQLKETIRRANRYDSFNYCLTREENDRVFAAQEADIYTNIQKSLADGAVLYGIGFGRDIGFVAVNRERVDHLYVEGAYRAMGFGTQLLQYALSVAGEGAYLDVPVSNPQLLRICERIGLIPAETADSGVVRMKKTEKT